MWESYFNKKSIEWQQHVVHKAKFFALTYDQISLILRETERQRCCFRHLFYDIPKIFVLKYSAKGHPTQVHQV